jgi:hypothetical protein
MRETIRYADVLVVFVRERATITNVHMSRKNRQKSFMYILIVIIWEEIDTPNAASVSTTRKGIEKNVAFREFINGRKDRWFSIH